MGLAEQRAKDQATAAHMKSAGIERRTSLCPVCGKHVHANDTDGGKSMYSHIVTCRR